jgi:hypothetical protein
MTNEQLAILVKSITNLGRLVCRGLNDCSFQDFMDFNAEQDDLLEELRKIK